MAAGEKFHHHLVEQVDIYHLYQVSDRSDKN